MLTELQDKTAALADARMRFSELEAVMQRMAARSSVLAAASV